MATGEASRLDGSHHFDATRYPFHQREKATGAIKKLTGMIGSTLKNLTKPRPPKKEVPKLDDGDFPEGRVAFTPTQLELLQVQEGNIQRYTSIAIRMTLEEKGLVPTELRQFQREDHLTPAEAMDFDRDIDRSRQEAARQLGAESYEELEATFYTGFVRPFTKRFVMENPLKPGPDFPEVQQMVQEIISKSLETKRTVGQVLKVSI